jgi:hypothetical protein
MEWKIIFEDEKFMFGYRVETIYILVKKNRTTHMKIEVMVTDKIKKGIAKINSINATFEYFVENKEYIWYISSINDVSTYNNLMIRKLFTNDVLSRIYNDNIKH